jgi:hypothetical protein
MQIMLFGVVMGKFSGGVTRVNYYHTNEYAQS